MRVHINKGHLDQDIDDGCLTQEMLFRSEMFATIDKSGPRADSDLSLLTQAMRQGEIWIYNAPMSEGDRKEQEKELKL